MSEIKDKLKGVKDKVLGAGEDAKDTVTGHDEDKYTTEAGQKDDPLTSYSDKEPMTPAKIKEHEPTAVKREMTERITEPGQTGTNSEEAAEIARKKGMAKGTAGCRQKLAANKNKDQLNLINKKRNNFLSFLFFNLCYQELVAVCFASLVHNCKCLFSSARIALTLVASFLFFTPFVIALSTS